MKAVDSIQDLRIVLVDDDESIRRSLEFCFQRRKIPFHSFGTAEDALKQIRLLGTDLIVSDYNLPGLNGLQLVRELNGINPGLLKIIITAYGNLDIAAEAMRLGVHDFIQKPFDMETLESAIHAVVERMKHGLTGVLVNGRNLEGSEDLHWRERLEHRVAMTAHKINNSLFGIRGNAELGLMETSPCEPVRENLLHIIREVRQMTHVNKGLLSLCRESPELHEKIDSCRVVCECVERFRHEAALNGIDILFDSQAASFVIEGNKCHLQDILDNLIVNSIQELSKTEKPDKRIMIAIGNASSERCITVSDTGSGIEPAVRERLTQKGFTTKPDGHGLGLYIVKKLTENLGALLDIRSEPGEGTTVVIEFPVEVTGQTLSRDFSDALSDVAEYEMSDCLTSGSAGKGEADR